MKPGKNPGTLVRLRALKKENKAYGSDKNQVGRIKQKKGHSDIIVAVKGKMGTMLFP